MIRRHVSTIPLAPAERLVVDKFAEPSHGRSTYGYTITDTATARVLTSGVGFTTQASRDEAIAVGRRRTLGQRPRDPALGTESHLSVGCRGLLRAMVDRTWGTLA